MKLISYKQSILKETVMFHHRPTCTSYKLCVKIGSNLYSYIDRTTDLSLFKTITQNLESDENLIYVYETPDQALLELKDSGDSSFYQSRRFTKTIIKLLCMGDHKTMNEKHAFSSMTVLQEVDLPETAKDKPRLLASIPRKRSPLRAIRIDPLMENMKKIYLDVRVSGTSRQRYKSHSNKSKQERLHTGFESKPRACSNMKNTRVQHMETVKRSIMDSVHQKFQLIKKEMNWIDQEVKYMENIRNFNKLERTDTIRSSFDSTEPL